MFAKLTTSKIDGKTMTAMFYDKDKLPIETIHFGAQCYADYTVAPHDDDKQPDILKYIRLMSLGMIICQPVRPQCICVLQKVLKNSAIKILYRGFNIKLL